MLEVTGYTGRLPIGRPSEIQGSAVPHPTEQLRSTQKSIRAGSRGNETARNRRTMFLSIHPVIQTRPPVADSPNDRPTGGSKWSATETRRSMAIMCRKQWWDGPGINPILQYRIAFPAENYSVAQGPDLATYGGLEAIRAELTHENSIRPRVPRSSSSVRRTTVSERKKCLEASRPDRVKPRVASRDPILLGGGFAELGNSDSPLNARNPTVAHESTVRESRRYRQLYGNSISRYAVYRNR